jgi:hypothetical protein
MEAEGNEGTAGGEGRVEAVPVTRGAGTSPEDMWPQEHFVLEFWVVPIGNDMWQHVTSSRLGSLYRQQVVGPPMTREAAETYMKHVRSHIDLPAVED